MRWSRARGAVPLTLALFLVPTVVAAGGVEVFDEVWRLTADHFYDPELGGVDWQAARARWRPLAEKAVSEEGLAAALNGLLAELGTSHTRYLTPLEPAYYQLLDVFSGGPLEREIAALFPDGVVSYVGIGVLTRTVEDRHHVAAVLGGGPAEGAGLQLGDAILEVEGEPFHPIRSFAEREGTLVALRIQTGPDPESVEERSLVPRRLEPRAMFLEGMRRSARLFEPAGPAARVGYVRIYSWAGRAYQEELISLLASPPLREAEALVLDLRGGWGGASPEYLALFDRRSPVLEQIGRDGESRVWDPRWRRPAVLLVDGETRSGKEVIAWGFKRSGIGPVVGERTAGAVLGGRPFLLSDGSLLYLAVADVRVDGERLEGVGVEPDVGVPFRLPWAAGGDPQLEWAVKVAGELGRESP